jgi:predicted permease
LSHALWAGEFGADRAVIGRSISLDGRLFTVIGVMPPGFGFPDAATQLWVPVGQAFIASPQLEHDRNMFFFSTVARLAPDATIDQVTADLAVVAHRVNAAQRDNGPQTSLTPETQFSVIPLLAEVLQQGVAPRTLWVLFGAVGLVLLIACANVAALLLARATARRREVAVRQAIGAGRGRIVRQLLTESVVLALAAGVVGTIVAYWGVDALPVLWPDVLARSQEIALDGRVLGFALALSVLTGIVFGLVPALRASATSLEQTLRDEGGASTGSRRRGRINGAGVEGVAALVPWSARVSWCGAFSG